MTLVITEKKNSEIDVLGDSNFIFTYVDLKLFAPRNINVIIKNLDSYSKKYNALNKSVIYEVSFFFSYVSKLNNENYLLCLLWCLGNISQSQMKTFIL